MRGGAIRAAATALLCALFVAATSLAGAATTPEGKIRLTALGGVATVGGQPSGRPTPAKLKFAWKLKSVDGAFLPRLSRIELRLSTRIQIDSSSKRPRCGVGRLQDSTLKEALEECGDARVGSGGLVRTLDLPEDAYFAASERLYAFNGRYRGRPAILVVGGTESPRHRYLIPFVLRRAPGSTAQTLIAAVPPEASGVASGVNGAISYFDLTLSARGRDAREAGPYVTVSCPIPLLRTLALGRLAIGLEPGIEISTALSARCGDPFLFE